MASAAIAVAAVLVLGYFAPGTSIGPVARAQTPLNCPIMFERLQSELDDADEADSTGFNNHYWAVVVNRQGTVCAVAFSGRDRDSQWLLSRQIAAAKAFTANGLSLEGAPISTAQLYPWVQPGAPAIRCWVWPTGIPSTRTPRTRATTTSSARATIPWSANVSAARSRSAAGWRSTPAATSRAASASRAIPRAPIIDSVALAGEPPARAARTKRYHHAERHVRSSALSERRRNAGGDAVGSDPPMEITHPRSARYATAQPAQIRSGDRAARHVFFVCRVRYRCGTDIAHNVRATGARSVCRDRMLTARRFMANVLLDRDPSQKHLGPVKGIEDVASDPAYRARPGPRAFRRRRQDDPLRPPLVGVIVPVGTTQETVLKDYDTQARRPVQLQAVVAAADSRTGVACTTP